MNQPLPRLALGFLLISLLLACGQTGELSLPDAPQAPTAEHTTSELSSSDSH